jgi:hypothetical protein
LNGLSSNSNSIDSLYVRATGYFLLSSNGALDLDVAQLSKRLDYLTKSLDFTLKLLDLSSSNDARNDDYLNLREKCKFAIDIVERQIDDEKRLNDCVTDADVIAAQSVDVVESISLKEFQSRYAIPHRPVVVCRHSAECLALPAPAACLSDFELLANEIGLQRRIDTQRFVAHSLSWAKLEACRQPTSVRAFFAQFSPSSSLDRRDYLFDWSIRLNAPHLEQLVSIPLFCRNDYLSQLSARGVEHMYNNAWPSLFVAKKNTNASLHIDSFGMLFLLLVSVCMCDEIFIRFRIKLLDVLDKRQEKMDVLFCRTSSSTLSSSFIESIVIDFPRVTQTRQAIAYIEFF